MLKLMKNPVLQKNKLLLSKFDGRLYFSSLPKESYTEKMEKTGRPISPHVTIYAFPIAAISSIANRFAGLSLSAGVSGIAVLTLAGIDVHSLMPLLGASLIGPVAKLCVAFPLTYHYLAGIRHILWDKIPKTLDTKQVSQSTYYLYAATGAITAGLVVLQL